MQVGFWAALVSYVDRSFAAHLIMIGTLVCMGYRQVVLLLPLPVQTALLLISIINK